MSKLRHLSLNCTKQTLPLKYLLKVIPSKNGGSFSFPTSHTIHHTHTPHTTLTHHTHLYHTHTPYTHHTHTTHTHRHHTHTPHATLHTSNSSLLEGFKLISGPLWRHLGTSFPQIKINLVKLHNAFLTFKSKCKYHME